MKIEDQEQQVVEVHSTQHYPQQLPQPRSKSRNAAERQCMSLKTVQDKSQLIMAGTAVASQFGPHPALVAAQQHFQQAHAGQQSLTALTLNSVQEDCSARNLTGSVHSLEQSFSQTNIDQKLHGLLQNVPADTRQRRHIQSRNIQNFMNTSSNNRAPQSQGNKASFLTASKPPAQGSRGQNSYAVATPYHNADVTDSNESQRHHDDVHNLQLIMNLNKSGLLHGSIPVSRNTQNLQSKMQHHTHQVPTQLPGKTLVGMTENQSSQGEQSSSMLTIGLPSVISQMGGPHLLNVQRDASQHSSTGTFNLNMNVNVNITNPVALSNSRPAKNSLCKRQGRSRKVARNSGLASNVSANSAEKTSFQIQKLIDAQRSNANSLKSLKRMEKLGEQAKREQITGIVNNLRNLNFVDHSHHSKHITIYNGHQGASQPFSTATLHQKSVTKVQEQLPVTGTFYSTNPAIPRRHIPVKAAQHSNISVQNQKKLQDKNLRSQHKNAGKSGQAKRAKTIPANAINLVVAKGDQETAASVKDKQEAGNNVTKNLVQAVMAQSQPKPEAQRDSGTAQPQKGTQSKVEPAQMGIQSIKEEKQSQEQTVISKAQKLNGPTASASSQPVLAPVRDWSDISKTLNQFKQKNNDCKAKDAEDVKASEDESFQSSSKQLTLTIDEESLGNTATLSTSQPKQLKLKQIELHREPRKGSVAKQPNFDSNPYEVHRGLGEETRERLRRLMEGNARANLNVSRPEDQEFTFECKEPAQPSNKPTRQRNNLEHRTEWTVAKEGANCNESSNPTTSMKIRTKRKENRLVDSVQQYEHLKAQKLELPTNSFSQESSFKDVEEESQDYEEAAHARLDAMESGQFDTLVELQPSDRARRFDCESSEVEIQCPSVALPVYGKTVGQIPRSDIVQPVMRQAARPPVELYNQREQAESHQFFEQRSEVGELMEHPDEHSQHEVLQTAVVGSKSSSIAMQEASYLKYLRDQGHQMRETPGFEDNRTPPGHADEDYEPRHEESDNMRTVIVKTSVQTKDSVLEAGSRNSKMSQPLDLKYSSASHYRGTNTSDVPATVQMHPASEMASTPDRLPNQILHQASAHHVRNRRQNQTCHDVTASRNLQASSIKDNMSLEKRLKDEKTQQEGHQGRMAESRVSKQRVKCVPVSCTPKKLENLTASRMHSAKQSGNKAKRNRTLSIEQDAKKKNVYHIFGRQTSESQVSLNVKQDAEPRQSQPGNLDQNEQENCSSLVNYLSNQDTSVKKHRKLLFNPSQYHPGQKPHSYQQNPTAFEDQRRGPPSLAGTSMDNYQTRPAALQSYHHHSMSIPLKKQPNKQSHTKTVSNGAPAATVSAFLEETQQKKPGHARAGEPGAKTKAAQAIKFTDINQGVVYDSQGRGRRMEAAPVQLSQEANPYNPPPLDTFVKKRINSQHQDPDTQNHLMEDYRRSTIVSVQTKALSRIDQGHISQYKTISNHCSEQLPEASGRRQKKPRDIYALERPQTVNLQSIQQRPEPHALIQKSSNRGSKVLSLQTYQPEQPFEVYHKQTSGQGQRRQELHAPSRRGRSDPSQGCEDDGQSLRIHHVPSSQQRLAMQHHHDQQDSSRVLRQAEGSTSSQANTAKAQPLLHRGSRESRTLSPFQKSDQSAGTQKFGHALKSWMRSVLHTGAPESQTLAKPKGGHSASLSLLAKTSLSFTRNRLHREAHSTLQHDDIQLPQGPVVAGSPRPRDLEHLGGLARSRLSALEHNQKAFQTVHHASSQALDTTTQPTRGTQSKELLRNLQRGRFKELNGERPRHPASQGPVHRLDVTDHRPTILGLESGGQLHKVSYRSLERADEDAESKQRLKRQVLIGSTSQLKNRKNSLAALCCLQSKSRNASVESQEAVRLDQSDNASSGCTVF